MNIMNIMNSGCIRLNLAEFECVLPGRDLEPGFGVRPLALITSTSSWPFLSIKPIWTSPVYVGEMCKHKYTTIRDYLKPFEQSSTYSTSTDKQKMLSF